MIKNDIISIERCWYIVDHLVYSPRMWRSSPLKASGVRSELVFSTYVEVILNLTCWSCLSCRILHVCGGHPYAVAYRLILIEYSPRMWRSSQRTRCPVCEHWVFSTYVEVILLAFPDDWKFYGILHVCGGHPITISIYNLAVLYSPRMWRSSYDKKVSDIMMGVFSTYVEVILFRLVVFM